MMRNNSDREVFSAGCLDTITVAPGNTDGMYSLCQRWNAIQSSSVNGSVPDSW